MERVRRSRPEEAPKYRKPEPTHAWDMHRERQPQFEVETIREKSCFIVGSLTIKIDRKNRYYWYFLGEVSLAFARTQIDAAHNSTYILSINGQGAEAKQFPSREEMDQYLIQELQA